MRYSRDYRTNLDSWNRGTRLGYGADYYGSESLDRSRSLGRTNLSRGYDVGYRGRDIETIRARPTHRGYDAGYRSRDWGDRLRSGWNELKHEARDFLGRDQESNRGRHLGARGYDRW